MKTPPSHMLHLTENRLNGQNMTFALGLVKLKNYNQKWQKQCCDITYIFQEIHGSLKTKITLQHSTWDIYNVLVCVLVYVDIAVFVYFVVDTCISVYLWTCVFVHILITYPKIKELMQLEENWGYKIDCSGSESIKCENIK